MNIVQQLYFIVCLFVKVTEIFVLCEKVYSDTYAVHIKGGPRVARAVIEEHGFTYIDKVKANALLCHE